MRRKLLCWSWGHTVATRHPVAETDVMTLLVYCRRCGKHLDHHRINQVIPDWVALRSSGHVTLGWLRRLAEYASCHFLGHDDERTPDYSRFDWYFLRCKTCGDVQPMYYDREVRWA